MEYRFLMFQNCILGQKRNGFFIESGAYTGEYLSNSLYFEIKRNYSGLFDTNWYFPTIQLFDEFSKGFIIEEVNDYSEKVFWWSPTFSIIKNCWEKIDEQHQLMLVMPLHLSQLWSILLTPKLFQGFKVIA